METDTAEAFAMEPDSALESEDDNTPIEERDSFLPVDQFTEAMGLSSRAKVSDDDGKDEEYNDTKGTSEDEYENPDMSSDSEELDEGDIELINAENVRVIMKNAGPSAEEVTHNVRNDTKYHLLKADQTYKKSFHYRQLCRQDVEVNFRNSL
ncbi:hypothetical protein DTO280E4_7921 [Paecilomyces variotii]|nr:hypothetical protein DTO280E4_7921 [Paecilomyces variotii]